MAVGPHISLSAETLFTISGFPVSNSIFTSLILSGLLITLAVIIRLSLKNTAKPSGLQNVAEWAVEALYNMIHSVTGSHEKARFFFPFIASFFFFILVNNWASILPGVGTIGIVHEEAATEEHASIIKQLPGIKQVFAAETTDDHAVGTVQAQEHSDEDSETGDHAAEGESHAVFVPIFRPGSADLNTTLALALVSVAITQFIGVRYLKLSYFKKFINFSSPIMFVVGLLELISEFAKIISFAFRLFGNIFAGEVLLVVIGFIGGTFLFFAPIPFYGLEVFVGFIQALVFSMLSLVFFNMATIGHDDH